MMSSEPIYKRLAVVESFGALEKKQRYYAYHMSRASWLGTRIILNQVSPESSDIFDLIIELHKSCKGQWSSLIGTSDHITEHSALRKELHEFLTYSALFLGNIGNYYGIDGQKIVPKVSEKFIMNLASKSERALELAKKCVSSLVASQPAILGYPTSSSQSAYYLDPFTSEEVNKVSNFLLKKGIGLENTRLAKSPATNNTTEFLVLQASIEKDDKKIDLGVLDDWTSISVKLVRGDHSEYLKRISLALADASCYCENTQQAKVLQALQIANSTGRQEDNKDAVRLWIRDPSPKVEHILGFVEQYHDPHGTRSEFEGLTAIQDPVESRALQTLIGSSQKFIATLPWIGELSDKSGNGPFENDLLEPPSFNSNHVLAYAATNIWMGKNLPTFNDIKQQVGMKNMIFTNNDTTLSDEELDKACNAPFVKTTERMQYLKHRSVSYKQKVIIHELFGHGTGKLLNCDNFDIQNPPISPVSGKPITSWYKAGEDYYSVFGSVATAMEECRAESVGIDLMCDKELLKIFGYTDSSIVTADQLIYNAYLNMAVSGIEALLSYSPESKTWGSAHDHARFAIMRAFQQAKDFMKIDVDFAAKHINVTIDKDKIFVEARNAVRELLLKLHIYRCTADVDNGQGYFGELTKVNEYWLSVRDIVAIHPPRRKVPVFANTFEEDGEIFIKEYDASAEGCIESWAERVQLLSL